MKVKHILTSAFLAATLSGCLQTQPYTIVVPQADPNGIEKRLDLPQSIAFDKQNYGLLYKNALNAEYYLNGEKDFGWSKLITVSYANGVYNIDDFTNALKDTLEKQKSNGAKNEYKFEKLSQNKAIATEIYYPINNPNFNKFEANLKIFEIKNCGAVNVHYAMNFDKNTDIKIVRKAINDKKAYFLKNYPKIECKENNTIKNSKFNFPANLKYMDINFEKFKEYPLMYGTKDTSAVTYFSQKNSDLGQIDLIFSPDYNKADFNSFLNSTEKMSAKFSSKNEAKVEKLGENMALQTMLWYPGDQKGVNDYEMNFSIIELKNCGMTQTIHKQRLDAKTGKEADVKRVFERAKSYFLQNYPKTSCK